MFLPFVCVSWFDLKYIVRNKFVEIPSIITSACFSRLLVLMETVLCSTSYVGPFNHLIIKDNLKILRFCNLNKDTKISLEQSVW